MASRAEFSLQGRQAFYFALLLAQRTAGAITVETVTAGRRNPIEYPEQREGSTAGEWNAVAAQNNRVEFHVIPAG